MLIVDSFNVENIKFQNGQYLCKDWLTGFSLSNAIVYSTAVLLVVLNAIIVAILGCKGPKLTRLSSAYVLSEVPHEDRGEGIKHHQDVPGPVHQHGKVAII